jgi:hypothetical protein
MTLFWLYIIIGSCCVAANAYRIADEVPDPGNIASAVTTGLKWIVTWPWWVFRK